MAVTDYADFLAKLAHPFQTLYMAKDGGGGITAGKGRTTWVVLPEIGVAPTTAVVPTKDTAGALAVNDRTTNPALNAYLAEANIAMRLGGGAGIIMIYDRLSHQGGLSGTVTGLVTTNLPTAALTRYTSGAGVMAGIEIWTAIGATPTTITCSYTNQDGTSGRTSQPIVIGGTGFSALGHFLPISLQVGDTGVRSIESSTLLATTGTAGAFGYVLFKILAIIPMQAPYVTAYNMLLGGGMQMAEVLDDACLSTFWTGSANAMPGWAGHLKLIEA